MTPEFSIVIPAYNVEAYLGNTLKSLDRQTCRDFEVILVDDGSTDGTGAICDDYAAARDGVRVIHQSNRGLSGARNSGLGIAEGEFVIFLDGDDTFQDDAIDIFREGIEICPDASLVGAGYHNVSPEEIFSQSKRSHTCRIYDDVRNLQNEFLRRRTVVLAPGTAYRRQWMADNELHFRTMPFSEDIFFIWTALTHAHAAVYMDTEIYNYLQRPGSIMHSVKTDSLIEAYSAYKGLERQLYSSLRVSQTVKCFLKARWVLGALHTASRRGFDRGEFSDLMAALDGEANMQTLRCFPDFRVRLLARVCTASPKLFKHLLKWR